MKFQSGMIMLALLCLGGSACNRVTEEQVAAESDKADAFFERVFNDRVDRSPMMQTMLGIRKNYGEWDDLSDAFAKKEMESEKQELATLRRDIHYDHLDAARRLSYDLFVEQTKEDTANFKYRFHNYPVNQMFGLHSQIPAFLINMHQVQNRQDAEAYISRLQKVPHLFGQLLDGLKIRERKGIIPPRFVFAHVLRDCRNIINGTTLTDDFRGKVDNLDSLGRKERNDLILRAESAIQDSVAPAYEMLISYLRQLESKATDDDGAWKFPDGSNFYNARLREITTTELTASQIHALGLAEVKRIHAEMVKIKDAVGFEGGLPEFFEFMRTNKRFVYPNTEKGRREYLARATEIIETMKGRLDELFIRKPKADIVVKRVEAFREQSAGKAFYERPAMDGSRPGTFYANLYDMNEMPTYQMEALAYHEGIPGHHMQIAIAQELEDIPKFRKFGGYTAYVEGWGLYSEFIPKEMGFYSDPYSDFGRLAMELWRACRLVVDTGIHAMKWTRQQGIDYYVQNTPNPKGDAVKMVERHIVAPGQATAYKIGMLKILELREMARLQLGDKFDIREFHDVVLGNGPVPLDVLDRMVKDWVATKRL